VTTILSRINIETAIETLGDLMAARDEAERFFGRPPTRLFLTVELARRLTNSDDWPDTLLGLKVVGSTRLAFDCAESSHD
jgi:hypothetical protein